MEKSKPFPSGYGFGQKSQRYLALNYELSINTDTEDCNNINLFLLAYCIISIPIKILELCLYDISIYQILRNSYGFSIWIYGIYVLIRCKYGYKCLKASKIKINSYFLLSFLCMQCTYSIISISLCIDSEETMDFCKIFKSDDIKNSIHIFFSMLAFGVIFSLYAFFLNFNLARKIREYNLLSCYKSLN